MNERKGSGVEPHVIPIGNMRVINVDLFSLAVALTSHHLLVCVSMANEMQIRQRNRYIIAAHSSFYDSTYNKRGSRDYSIITWKISSTFVKYITVDFALQ